MSALRSLLLLLPSLFYCLRNRELAMQIAAEAKLLLTYHKLNVITTVGGVAMTKDLRYVSVVQQKEN